MIKYNKLIRDKIPTILEDQKKEFKTHKATEEEYMQKLQEKLLEEVSEFLEKPCLEELADIQEVLNTILYVMNISGDDLLKEMVEKSILRGAFEEKLILDWVKE